MAYQRLTGFMYSEVGEKVGAWRREGEPAIVPLSLPAIVQGYVDTHSRLSVLLLKREIHGYLRNNLTPGGLRNAAPFDYELCFSEHYFGCNNHQFLLWVCRLLDENLKRTQWRGIKRLFNRMY